MCLYNEPAHAQKVLDLCRKRKEVYGVKKLTLIIDNDDQRFLISPVLHKIYEPGEHNADRTVDDHTRIEFLNHPVAIAEAGIHAYLYTDIFTSLNALENNVIF